MICYKMWPYEIDIYSCLIGSIPDSSLKSECDDLRNSRKGMIGDRPRWDYFVQGQWLVTRWSNFRSKTAWHGFRWMNSNWIIFQIKHFMVFVKRKEARVEALPHVRHARPELFFFGKRDGTIPNLIKCFPKNHMDPMSRPFSLISFQPLNCLSGGKTSALVLILLISGFPYLDDWSHLETRHHPNLIENCTIQLRFCCCNYKILSRRGLEKNKLLFLGSMLGTIYIYIYISSYHPNLSKLGQPHISHITSYNAYIYIHI